MQQPLSDLQASPAGLRAPGSQDVFHLGDLNRGQLALRARTPPDRGASLGGVVDDEARGVLADDHADPASGEDQYGRAETIYPHPLPVLLL